MTEVREDPRLDRLVDLVVRLASGDLAARLEPSSARDAVDAVITGINLLADELEEMYQDLEQRVAERTAALDQAHLDLERMALSDSLTGLANRTLLNDRIQQAVARAERGAQPPAVLLLDLDEFKTINDSLGHGAGDAVLVEVARRLTSVIRDTDTVARLGGDEFAIVMPDATEEQALRVAQRALKALRLPVTVGDRAVWALASIGLRFGSHSQTAEILLRDADTAMYAAKARGRGNIQVFQPAMHSTALARMQVATELGAALAAGQLSLHYQPIVELATGEIIGAEALVRWLHPERGQIIPAEFISVAEDSGLIVKIGHWGLRTAIGQLAAWARQFPLSPGFRLHVNLSPFEVRRPGLSEHIERTLEHHDVSPSRLTLEIAETGLMTGDTNGVETLLRLQALGISIEVDDFGTGHSSISSLRRLAADSVKLDESLIVDIASDPQQRQFVGAILQLIESIGLGLVVEGVETAAQLDELQALGCRYGQGYYFSPAVTVEVMTHLLLSRAILGNPAGRPGAPGRPGNRPSGRSNGKC